jgi:hypothetical protein
LCKTADTCDFAVKNSILARMRRFLASRQVLAGLSDRFSQVFLFLAVIDVVADGCLNQL